MKLHYDLHVHSALSPCSDILMTPNNLFNMASLKGLNIIAITDHNSLKQLPVIREISLSYDIVLVYGVEITLVNEVHVLCYFKTIEDAMNFDKELENYLVKASYDSFKLGEQILTDNEDLTVSVVPYYLGEKTLLSFETLTEILKRYNHLLFLAHIDRDKNSGIQYLNHSLVHGVECTKNVKKEFLKLHQLEDKNIFYNSDAHQLTEISEKDTKNVLHLKECSIDAFFKYFNHG